MNIVKEFRDKIKSMNKYFYNSSESHLTEITIEKFLESVNGDLTGLEDKKPIPKIHKAYEIAFLEKKNASDNYWTRANYFWAFQAASFAGYFALLSSDNIDKILSIVFYVNCIGFISSLAWTLINKGSKTWQRKWQNVIELIEDDITGPLYQTVMKQKTYSVSKINEIISTFFVITWLSIGVIFLIENFDWTYSGLKNINWGIVSAILITFYFSIAMIYGHGRGRFTKRTIKLYQRTTKLGV